jgi:hypothetical protein
MEDVGLFYGHLVYFVDFIDIWYLLGKSDNPARASLQ